MALHRILARLAVLLGMVISGVLFLAPFWGVARFGWGGGVIPFAASLLGVWGMKVGRRRPRLSVLIYILPFLLFSVLFFEVSAFHYTVPAFLCWCYLAVAFLYFLAMVMALILPGKPAEPPDAPPSS